MASAAEQMASNISLGSFGKATELKKRLWFTIGALVLFGALVVVLNKKGEEAKVASAVNSPDARTVLSPPAKFGNITLHDGSLVQLAPGPKLTIPEEFAPGSPRGDAQRGAASGGGSRVGDCVGAGRRPAARRPRRTHGACARAGHAGSHCPGPAPRTARSRRRAGSPRGT